MAVSYLDQTTQLINDAMETKKHSYKVRPAYVTKELLIEFGPDSYDEQFIADLRLVLAENNLTAENENDLVFSYSCNFESPCGPFELHLGEWSDVFIHAEENQDAIHYMDRILRESGKFEKQEVNNEDYA